MSFIFNFDVDDPVCDFNHCVSMPKSNIKLTTEAHVFGPCSLKEIAPLEWNSAEFSFHQVELEGKEKLFYVFPNRPNACGGAHKESIDCKIKSDRIKGMYEGGAKVWECSVDLARFVLDEIATFCDKIVLEIGCGVGLPGIVASKRCKKIMFQDLNEFVLREYTAPSVGYNEKMQRGDANDVASRTLDRFQFIAGDWNDVMRLVVCKADIILTAETIYDPENYGKLHDLIEHVLTDNGVAFVASKCFYFGVGGGTFEWVQFVKFKKVFHVEVVACIEAPLKREILKMTRLCD